ncbi:lipoprotein insertase outer membrane protein LolB [Aliiglaciecola sp. CAU 1673]|uniref:lipoprotein insertase outer membrane protein LolB n=1 Tax=Aliiglaciecola sp. CAU 1673 TaxID=3032595 RepID=UPI0023D9EF2B|nr:lipoprotein insertase outer membrane protein LolB [Aliiglaciecola sp. CAU 1673]MDF2179387.1 lipoprotein insertase outer membrane protein LolB [Aliiglaciecola sp. CAU 1673]
MPRSQVLGFPFLLILLTLLSACASVPRVEQVVDASEHQQALAQLKQWRINGKLAFKGENDKFSAALNWRQSDTDYELLLSNLFGTTLLKMTQHQGLVELQYDGKDYQHYDAASLLHSLTGWQMPVNDLPLWLKGQRTDGTRILQADKGLIYQLESPQGWLVELADYRQVDNYALPYSLQLTAGQNQIKIRVNQWTLN